MATKPKTIKELGLSLNEDFMSTDDLWLDILRKKYSIQEFKDVLLKTGDSYLLEFDRMAKAQTEKNKEPFWGGLIDNDKLYGNNQMGKYLMIIRDELKD